jgi:5-methylcytosine-specific restriction protein A
MPHDSFYNSAKWRKTRAEFLGRFPWCETCARVGIRTRAQEVDHRKSLRSGGAPFDHANLCGLCKTHHSQKTIYVDGQHKHVGKQLVVTGPDGFPLDNNQGVLGHGRKRTF